MGEKLSRLWFTAPAEKQSADKGQTVNEIPISEIEPNPFQPRKIFAPEQLAELSESIKNYGLLQPVLVRRINGRYQLISGERRLRASMLAGLEKIPAIVRELQTAKPRKWRWSKIYPAKI